MEMITDTLVLFEEYNNSYLVQCKINLDMSKIFMIREACDLDIPDMRDIVLSSTYTGPKNLNHEDFSVVVLNTGTEFILRVPYYDIMAILVKENTEENGGVSTEG
jgi:hypothetical protein